MAFDNEDDNAPEGSLCVASIFFDQIMAVIFPPLYVFFHEYRKTPKFKDVFNIIKNLILTSMFYVPGMMHAMYLMYNDY
jgi:uncharacterized membrane protein YqaE (UPF0057 family)